MNAVTIRGSELESKGYLTFSACAPNKARTWGRKLPEEGLKQDLIEELFQTAVANGYDNRFEVRLHPDDFARYNDPMKFNVIRVVNT